MAAIDAITPDEIERFWAFVQVDNGSCWLWSGGKDSVGYGVFNLAFRRTGARMVKAHRLMYRLVYGGIPEGQVVMHSCDNPACVRPGHLKAGTLSENTRQRESNGRSGSRKHVGWDIAEQVRASTEGATALADRLGISRQTVYQIRRGRVYSGRSPKISLGSPDAVRDQLFTNQ